MREIRTLKHRSERHVVRLPPDVWEVLDACSCYGRLSGKEGLKLLCSRWEWESIVHCLKRASKEWPEQIRIAAQTKQAALDARPLSIKQREREEAEASRLLSLELALELGIDEGGLFESELKKACRCKSAQANYMRHLKLIDSARRDRELNELLELSASFDFEAPAHSLRSLQKQIKQLEALF